MCAVLKSCHHGFRLTLPLSLKFLLRTLLRLFSHAPQAGGMNGLYFVGKSRVVIARLRHSDGPCACIAARRCFCLLRYHHTIGGEYCGLSETFAAFSISAPASRVVTANQSPLRALPFM
jgi:hypothetical protein